MRTRRLDGNGSRGKLLTQNVSQCFDPRALGGERRIVRELPLDRERIARDRARRRRRRGRAARHRRSAGGSFRSWLVRSKRRDQATARARQARHHGADRHLGDLRDLAVVEALNVAQHQRLAELIRQRRDRGFELEPRRPSRSARSPGCSRSPPRLRCPGPAPARLPRDRRPPRRSSGDSCRAMNRRCCARSSVPRRAHCRRRNCRWRGTRAGSPPAPRPPHRRGRRSASARAYKRPRGGGRPRSRTALCRRHRSRLSLVMRLGMVSINSRLERK